MKISATIFYPGGFHIKEKKIELTHMEKEIRIILGECY